MLSGTPESQLEQLRAYLVRLIGYIDEEIRSIPAAGASVQQQEALAEWQLAINAAISSFKSALRASTLVQYGTDAAGSVTFARPYAAAPVVIPSAGSVSDVSATGFTLSSAASWIAAGQRR
jgi:hypothetical protein